MNCETFSRICRSGSDETLSRFIESNSEFDWVAGLVSAAHVEDIDRLRFLIAKAAASGRSYDRYELAEAAVSAHDSDACVEFLARQGADLNYLLDWCFHNVKRGQMQRSCVVSFGRQILSIGNRIGYCIHTSKIDVILNGAIAAGNVEVVKLALQAGASNHHERFHKACKYGRADIAWVLLRFMAENKLFLTSEELARMTADLAIVPNGQLYIQPTRDYARKLGVVLTL